MVVSINEIYPVTSWVRFKGTYMKLEILLASVLTFFLNKKEPNFWQPITYIVSKDLVLLKWRNFLKTHPYSKGLF